MAAESGASDHRTMILSHPLFQQLSDEEITALADRSTERKLEDGEKLIERGEFNYFLYLITGGSAEVLLEDGFTAPLGEGDLVGEISVSGMSSPVGDVTVKGGMSVLAFPIDLIADLEVEHEEFAEKLRAIASERIRETEF